MKTTEVEQIPYQRTAKREKFKKPKTDEVRYHVVEWDWLKASNQARQSLTTPQIPASLAIWGVCGRLKPGLRVKE